MRRLDIRVDEHIYQAVMARAQHIADITGREISVSSGARDMIRQAIDATKRQDQAIWYSAFSEGYLDGHRAMLLAFNAIRLALENGAKAEDISKAIRKTIPPGFEPPPDTGYGPTGPMPSGPTGPPAPPAAQSPPPEPAPESVEEARRPKPGKPKPPDEKPVKKQLPVKSEAEVRKKVQDFRDQEAQSILDKLREERDRQKESDADEKRSRQIDRRITLIEKHIEKLRKAVTGLSRPSFEIVQKLEREMQDLAAESRALDNEYNNLPPEEFDE